MTESSAARPAATPVQDASNFDLVDTDEERAPLTELDPVLQQCRPLVEVFCRANERAIFLRRRYSRVVSWAAVSGTAAVLLAVLQLAPWSIGWRYALAGLEGLSVLVMIAAIVFGVCTSIGESWRLERFRAEFCRVAKFHFLLNGGRLFVDSRDPRDGVDEKPLGEIIHVLEAELVSESLRDWVRRELPKLELKRPPAADVAPAAAYVDQLKEYYVAKRLEHQHAYFEREKDRREVRERSTKFWCRALLFGSLAAATAHLIVEAPTLIAALRGEQGSKAGENELGTAAVDPYVETIREVRILGVGVTFEDESDEHHGWVPLVLLLLAAGLPAIAAGFRTLRGAHEFGRNAIRFHALATRLDSLRDDLENATAADRKLEVMWQAEQELESEHRAWMRLMIEAEWFG
ncbi:MAG: hypothetical protein KY476_26325 [Planctomycetes bacterium]|nr:hypothetical protein [Planctomycetota bacterium]